MVYEWKMDVFRVDAQVAGEELERIGKTVGITPENVVNESRPEDAPLHSCFEWRDDVAADEWRKQQARTIIGAIVVKVEPDSGTAAAPVRVRAFHSVGNTYEPLEVIVRNQSLSQIMLDSAKRDLEQFRNKYRDLKSVVPVLRAIDMFLGGDEGDTGRAETIGRAG